MKTIPITYPHTFVLNELPETIAAIGFFDGIHKGHQKVIKEAVSRAKKENKTSAVISFHPHPSVVLKQSDEAVEYITPLREKEALLAELGVDRLYMITFNRQLSLLTPKAFIDHFIIGLHIEHLVAGFDFSFGHKGAGKMSNIESFSDGKFQVTEMEKVELSGEKVSSTNIRQALHAGKVDVASNYLGRKYKVHGHVIKGDQRGRQLGYPTANLLISEEKLLPKQGVYAVTVHYKEKRYNAMANLGVKPTFHTGHSKPSLEVYIFDFDQDIYGEDLTVFWHQFIREEKKFNGIDDIKQQLQQDEKTIRNYFN